MVMEDLTQSSVITSKTSGFGALCLTLFEGFIEGNCLGEPIVITSILVSPFDDDDDEED